MSPLTRARRLAFLRTEIVEPRPLSPAERRRRADAYLLAADGEPAWIRAWSQVMTWHLDRVERYDIELLIAERLAAHRNDERRRALGDHPAHRPSPHPREETES